MSTEQTGQKAEISVENIGGIERATVAFEPGVTLLVGNNATNRTSLLSAVMAVLGSDDAAVKGDADEGHVELTINSETYTRTLERDGTAVVTSGEPYLEDTTVADLFAFLLENNEARQAIAQNDDLREIIMRPVDTDEIQNELNRLNQHQDDLEQELEEIDSLKGQLPSLEEKRVNLQEEINEKRTELEELESELREKDTNVQQRQQEKNELEEKLDKLQQKRGELEDVRYDLETEQDSLSELKAEYHDLEQELSELSDVPAGELGDIESELDQLRTRKQEVKAKLSELQSIIQFNEDMLEEDGVISTVELDGVNDDSITDQLLPDETIQCWTCGSTVEREQINATVDQLQDVRQEKFQEVQNIESNIESLREQKQELEQQKRRREKLDMQLQRVERNIDESKGRITELQRRRDELTDAIEATEDEIDEQEDEERNEVLSLHKQANQLEYNLGQLENERERIEEEIADIEERIGSEGQIKAEIEETKDKIADLRTKIERIEQDAVEEFNRHMDAILDRLAYDNIDRIWLEQRETEVREGRRKVSKSVFELHVVRNTPDGVAYEDTVDHLSESEREVTGLIFALAGYLTHAVYETVPFMLLDSLEAIDAERIAKLTEYFQSYSQYLLVALLPEDASALDDDYTRVTEIEA